MRSPHPSPRPLKGNHQKPQRSVAGSVTALLLTVAAVTILLLRTDNGITKSMSNSSYSTPMAIKLNTHTHDSTTFTPKDKSATTSIETPNSRAPAPFTSLEDDDQNREEEEIVTAPISSPPPPPSPEPSPPPPPSPSPPPPPPPPLEQKVEQPPTTIPTTSSGRLDSRFDHDSERCTPTPWLLEKRKPDLPWVGKQNHLDDLLATQAMKLENDSGISGVSLLFFNYHQSEMLQNCLYSLIKFAGVCNYIVVVWDEPSLEVCLDMNMPCFNATAYIPGGGNIGAEQEAKLHSLDYNKITWMKPIMVKAVIEKGFAVHVSDVDIAYTPADLWKSYYKFIVDGNATAAFQVENHYPDVVNTGNYVILPTESGKNLMKLWVGRADIAIAEGNHEQRALGKLYNDEEGFEMCDKPPDCRRKVAAIAKLPGSKKYRFPLVRKTFNPWGNVYGYNCVTKEEELHKVHPAHPCSYPHMYFHAICVSGSTAKTNALKKAGLWFIDDDKGCTQDQDNPNTVRCKPLAWRKPEIEEAFSECSWKTRVAFKYFQPTA